MLCDSICKDLFTNATHKQYGLPNLSQERKRLMELSLFIRTFGRIPEPDMARFRWYRDEQGQVIVVFMFGMDTVTF
jgi:hypothetical protein